MKRIDSIHLKNFKAFRDQEFRFDGKNVLIYGNNGSGKSSLFWAIYTFFQSSGKDNSEITKYFLKFDSTNPVSEQSLRNIFAQDQDDAFIKLKWRDLSDQSVDENIISKDTINTNWSPKGDSIRDADLGSDFINYKLLHNFFNASNKKDTNLWDVFLRDIFPFFKPAYSKQDFRKEVLNLLKDVPRTKKKVTAGKIRDAFIEDIKKLNAEIDQFLLRIQDAANHYLIENSQPNDQKFEIALEYQEKINYDDIRYKRSSPKIRLLLRLWNKFNNNWEPILRPHTFLNEAMLTRVTLAVRFGALLTRIEQSNFKVLCLDDMLISLDMSNRMQVVRRLLDTTKSPYKDYQIIMLTHDRAFYQIVKHQIGIRQVGKIQPDGTTKKVSMRDDWYYWELYNDEYHQLEQPHLATGDDDLELAEKFFQAFQFAACANHLRKECEKRIKIFLPEHLWFEIHYASGDIRHKLLGSLIDELEEYHKKNGKDFSPFANLKLYKDLLMNPLSHDNYGTSVFQTELREIMDNLIPKLGQLKNEIVFEVERGKEKILNLKIMDDQGEEWTYRVQILEHFRRITYLDGVPVYSKTACRVIDARGVSGIIKTFNNSYDSIDRAYKRVAKLCKMAEPYPDILTIIS